MRRHRDKAQTLLAIRRLLVRAEERQRGKGTGVRRKVRTRPQIDPGATGEQAFEPFTASAPAPPTARQGAELKAAFWHVTGPAPVCGPGDVGAAQHFYRLVERAIDMDCWSHSEHTMLLEMEKIWGARARGEDPRFVLVGNRPGRLAPEIERKIAVLRDHKQRGS